MKERPILFSTEMVHAVLGGRKTQTRRLNNLKEINENPDNYRFIELVRIKGVLYAEFMAMDSIIHKYIKCPFDSNELWVRETFQKIDGHFLYRALWPNGPIKSGWKPSIFMPRSASRIQLLIKDIRVERVQDIKPSDCEDEGITGTTHGTPVNGLPYEIYKCGDFKAPYPKTVFKDLWDSINANRKDKHGNILPYSWDDNPWVWVIEFERLLKKRGE